MKRLVPAVLAALVVLSAVPPAAARPRAGNATDCWGFTDHPVEPDDSPFPLAVPTYLRTRTWARATYQHEREDAEEERLAKAIHIPYDSRSGLRVAEVHCEPLCSIVGLSLHSPLGDVSTRALANALSAVSPVLVGANPTRGLGAPEQANGLTWFPRKAHPRYPCDCAVGTRGKDSSSVTFESLDGAEKLPPDVKYTRGEAADAAARQLVALDARIDGEPEHSVVVVSAGNRARLCHRFVFQLDARRHTVDVEDASLEVVKMVLLEERGDRYPGKP